ncbi:hypothetical protein [Streptomyces sp. NPDC002057]|uniref:hypothetical protein n=1 Tax=Streptomyces sp. NPDC002057 TaxID=3154664 RepID=UPI0033276036
MRTNVRKLLATPVISIAMPVEEAEVGGEVKLMRAGELKAYSNCRTSARSTVHALTPWYAGWYVWER